MCAVQALPTPCSPQHALEESNNMNLTNHQGVTSGHTMQAERGVPALGAQQSLGTL